MSDRSRLLWPAAILALAALALAVNLTGVAGAGTRTAATTPRIVRGIVNLSTSSGQGFTVTHTRTTIGGRVHIVYTVAFSTHFSTFPVVVAAPEHTCYAFTRENAETSRSGFKANLTGCAQFTFVALESHGD
jgi:hypothetical protein